jgi:hypothetical protein
VKLTKAQRALLVAMAAGQELCTYSDQAPKLFRTLECGECQRSRDVRRDTVHALWEQGLIFSCGNRLILNGPRTGEAWAPWELTEKGEAEAKQ